MIRQNTTNMVPATLLSYIILFLLMNPATGCDDDIDMAMGENETYADYLDRVSFSGAVLIARNGQTVFSQGVGFANKETGEMNQPSTKFRIGSITKQFTATAMLILQEDGLVNIDDPVINYLPDYPKGEQFTLRHLLSHTAGIPEFSKFADFRSFSGKPHTPTEMLVHFKDLPLDFVPGTQYSYSNSGYCVLGVIIETVSGMSYADYLTQKIFHPLGMADTEYGSNVLGEDRKAVGYREEYKSVPYHDMSVPYAAGALSSTVEDIQKWDQAFSAHVLITAESTEMMTTRVLENYGLGLFIDEFQGHRQHHHGGEIDGFRSKMARYPDDGILIVVLGNFQDFSVEELLDSLSIRVLGE